MRQNKNLPNCWWITPGIDSIKEIPALLKELDNRIGEGIQHVQLMQKKLDNADFKYTYEKFSAYCRAQDVFLLIHRTAEETKSLGALGCCYYAEQLKDCISRPLPEPYWVGVYCHNVEELKKAKALGADFASLSIVKPSKTHPGQPAMGWDVFEESIAQVDLPVYAVGGMNLSDKEEAIKRGAKGIMGIRFNYPGV